MAESTRTDAQPGKRTRRNVLKGVGLGAAALAARGLGRTPAAEATQGDPVIAGESNTATAATGITTVGSGAPRALDVQGDDIGVQAAALNLGSTGVFAVTGGGNTGKGVVGKADYGCGVCGVINLSTQPLSTPASTAVYGLDFFDDLFTLGTGVHGKSPAGWGVKGETATGVAVLATETSGDGTALQVEGKAVFSRSGSVTVPVNSQVGSVTGVALTADSLVMALVQQASANYVISVAKDVGAGSFKVYLKSKAAVAITVGWFLVN
jgi:hypothetical protein